MDVGPISSTGMGVSAVSWSDVQAWRNLTGHAISEWAAETIRAASREYASQVSACDGKPTPAPWRETREDPVDVMNQIKAGMRALMMNRGKRR